MLRYEGLTTIGKNIHSNQLKYLNKYFKLSLLLKISDCFEGILDGQKITALRKQTLININLFTTIKDSTLQKNSPNQRIQKYKFHSKY